MECSEFCNKFIDLRVNNHNEFIEQRKESGKEIKYHIKYHDLPCITKQETEIKIRKIGKIELKSSSFLVTYNDNFQSKLET